MSSITQINMNDIPSTVKLFTKGAKTKKIYLKGEPRVAIEEFEKFITSFNLPFDEYITLAKSTSEELKILGSSGSKMKNVSIFIYKENNLIKEQSIGDRGALGIACYGSFLVEFDEPITIQSSRSSYIYYEEYNPIELKPMPKIDKLIDSSTFENVSAKLQEINNLLKVSSDNLKTIMDANNLMYESTDSFIDLMYILNEFPTMLVDGRTFNDTVKSIEGFNNVTEITFKKERPSINGVDISNNKDKTIVASVDGNILKISYTGNIEANQNSSYMFENFTNISKINNFDKLSLSKITNCDRMFYYCSSLSGEITIDNPNISSYNEMFYHCSHDSNTRFIVKYIDSTKVLAGKIVETKDYSDSVYLNGTQPIILFEGETFNKIIKNISNFENVKEIRFVNTNPSQNGVNVDLDGLAKAVIINNILNIQANREITLNNNCDYMFNDCSNVNKILFNNIKNKRITNANRMFNNCSSLTNIDLSMVEIYYSSINLFSNCTSLKSAKLNLSNNLRRANNMFYACTSLVTLDLGSTFTFERTEDINQMFFYCKNLNTTLTVAMFKSPYCTNMFYNCSTVSGKVIVNYKGSKNKTYAEKMVKAKSNNSNVVLGTNLSQ